MYARHFSQRWFLLSAALVLVSVFTFPTPAQLRAFKRGDCDGDGTQVGGVGDAIYFLRWTFLGGPAPRCRAACDNDRSGIDGSAGVLDVVYLLSYNFLGGPAPLAPFPDCGHDNPHGLGFGCEEYPAPGIDAGCPTGPEDGE